MNYVIQPGDTLYAIAQRFQTTVNAILAANPQITNSNVIFAGRTIWIPTAPAPPTPSCPLLRLGDRGPAVRRFQTLLRFAGFNPGPLDGIWGPGTQAALLAFQRSIRELEISGIADVETWTALGAECEPFSEPVSYTVRPGDTLFIIGLRFDLPVARILQANPQISNPNLLFAGQVIHIPPR